MTTSSGSSPRSSTSSRRTKIVTGAAIFAVVLGGAAAVSANVGILNAAGASKTGTLSAAGDLAPISAQAADLPPTTLAPSPPPATGPSVDRSGVQAAVADRDVQQFSVDAAGTMSLARVDGGIRLDSVSPAPGWSWSLEQRSPSELIATFANAERTLRFTASAAAGGPIVASLEEPILVVTSPPPPSPVANLPATSTPTLTPRAPLPAASTAQAPPAVSRPAVTRPVTTSSDEDHDHDRYEGGDDDD